RRTDLIANAIAPWPPDHRNHNAYRSRQPQSRCRCWSARQHHTCNAAVAVLSISGSTASDTRSRAELIVISTWPADGVVLVLARPVCHLTPQIYVHEFFVNTI